MTERELKLALPGRFTVPSLELDGAPLDVRPLEDLALRATYYDTADLRLARHGVSLRYRTGEPGGPTWTLKLPSRTSSGPTLERTELHFAGPQREPPAEARSLVTAYTRGQPLTAVATLRTRRRRMHLVPGANGSAMADGTHRVIEAADDVEPLDEPAKAAPQSELALAESPTGGSPAVGTPFAESPIAEIAVDEVSVVEGRRVVSRFRELEVEDLRGDVDLDGIARQLLAAGATGAEPIPKVVRALGSRATAPPDVVRPELSRSSTLGDVLRFALADAVLRLVHHDPAARLGDGEGVHQVRVAFRRLRSDLRTLDSAVDAEWRARIVPRLRDVAGSLAGARDLDVLLARLRRDVGEERRALGPMFDRLERRRVVAQAELHAALDSPDYVTLLDLLVAAAASPPVGPDGGAEAGTALPRLVLDSWQRFARRAEKLETDSPASDFHRARIAAKRARYATELAAHMLPDGKASDARRLAGKLADAQDQLGTVQDAAVAESTIRDTLGDIGRRPAYAFEAGRLVERQRMHAEDGRSEFLNAWPRLKRKKWRAWAT